MNQAKNRTINLEWVLVVLVALFAWQFGVLSTALFILWTVLIITATALGLLTYANSTHPHNSVVEIGKYKFEGRIQPTPSKRGPIVLMAGAIALFYLSLHGFPWVLFWLLAMVGELIPGMTSIWDEYISDVLRRATGQAGFIGMMAAIAAATSGLSGLEVAVIGLTTYVLCLQVFLFRWSRISSAET